MAAEAATSSTGRRLRRNRPQPKCNLPVSFARQHVAERRCGHGVPRFMPPYPASRNRPRGYPQPTRILRFAEDLLAKAADVAVCAEGLRQLGCVVGGGPISGSRSRRSSAVFPALIDARAARPGERVADESPTRVLAILAGPEALTRSWEGDQPDQRRRGDDGRASPFTH